MNPVISGLGYLSTKEIRGLELFTTKNDWLGESRRIDRGYRTTP